MASDKRKGPRRRASSFPPQFLKLLLHVANTGESIRIDTLAGNTRATYTSFRARVNEFRRAYHLEALAGDSGKSTEISDLLYSVVLREPSCDEDGQWYMIVEPKESGYAKALDAVLPDWDGNTYVESEDDEEAEDEEDDPAAEGRAAIRGLYGE